MICPNCKGNGEVQMDNPHWDGISSEPYYVFETCTMCEGNGDIPDEGDEQ